MKTNTKQNEIFAAHKIGARVIESEGFALAHINGRNTVHTYTQIQGATFEFALNKSQLEVYKFDNNGLAHFQGFAPAVNGIKGAIEAGRKAGLGMFQPCFTEKRRAA